MLCHHISQDFHSGKTALHVAVERASLPDVQFLVENCQVDINATTYSSCTALHMAAGRGDIVIVAYLLSMGANPDLLTDEGDSALNLAGSKQVYTLTLHIPLCVSEVTTTVFCSAGFNTADKSCTAISTLLNMPFMSLCVCVASHRLNEASLCVCVHITYTTFFLFPSASVYS